MVDVLNIQALLDTMKGHDLSVLERIILAHDGTVQTLLSVILGAPVMVRPIEQTDSHDGASIIRLVDLEAGNLVAARARSVIPKASNSGPILEAVQDMQLGLGQIAFTLQIKTQRDILRIMADQNTCSRQYRMYGNGLDFTIWEHFPRALYKGISQSWRWPQATNTDHIEATHG